MGLLSVLTKGCENCCDMPLPKMDDIERLTSENQDKVSMGSLFTFDGESAQEERDRQEQERLQAARAEAEAQTAASADSQEKQENEKPQGGKKRKNSFMSFLKGIVEKGEEFLDE